MRTTFILFLTLSFSPAFASNVERFGFSASHPKLDGYSQDRPFAIEYVMYELNRVHKAVFDLPFSQEYIKGTLIPEIEAKRQIIAPNYPSHELSVENQDLPVEKFNQWNIDHTQEFVAYIQYVNQFVADHQ